MLLTHCARNGGHIRAPNDQPSHRRSRTYVEKVVSDVGQHQLVVGLHADKLASAARAGKSNVKHLWDKREQ